MKQFDVDEMIELLQKIKERQLHYRTLGTSFVVKIAGCSQEHICPDLVEKARLIFVLATEQKLDALWKEVEELIGMSAEEEA